MKAFSSSQKENTDKDKAPEKPHDVVPPYPHEINIADGGEFLDDGIRTKEQPFGGPGAEEQEIPSADS